MTSSRCATIVASASALDHRPAAASSTISARRDELRAGQRASPGGAEVDAAKPPEGAGPRMDGQRRTGTRLTADG
ncbi:hypothetical protein ABZZ47_17580 [Streptomyces sp. NPDC006465]|uniref:hypothetical protein n=1 Tax=Streptomyces sp. NPDC006465 TaxID=3157174 RepID=UPI0033BCE9D6